jgi:hypothetical protein
MAVVDSVRPLIVNPEVIYTEVEDEIVMMAPEDGTYHGLNAVGAVLFRLVEDKAMCLNEMASYLKTQYALAHDAAMTDAKAFVDAMLSNNFFILTDEAA